ncbi:MAG: relaxase domain-containing protein, partial [Phaeodactylibacter sp.]|nr:relaxase domain-containing protein [Phaeodactylibacter sp.]
MPVGKKYFGCRFITMLRITHSKNAAGAAKYFDEGLQRADYFATNEHTLGEWGGKAAARLGLAGEVQKEDFVALCHNRKPDGSKLNPRNSDRRKVGYDFTFSVPKSASVAYAVTGDERIRQAFEKSVEETMREIEGNMRTQVGQGKDKQHAVTGEMLWASFTHRTSRPVDGIPDPHLHRHCFAINTTWNEQAERFQAGEFGNIKQMASYYEAAFESRMAMQMRQLGYPIERRGLSWEIQGIEDQTLKKFSRRTAMIENAAAKEQAKNGSLSARQKEKLGALTRARKLVGQSWEKLRQIWRSWLSGDEAKAIARAGAREVAVEKKKGISAGEAVGRAQLHLFQRKSVVKDYLLKAEALKRGYGDILPEDVRQAVDQGGFHQREVNGHNLLTTREAVEEEVQLLACVREGRGREFPLNAGYTPKAEYLNEEQRAAIKHALTDTNHVTIIAGGAGTGKTTLMKEVRDGIEARGKKFIGFAPSAAASRGVMREEGFDKADTLAQLLHNPKMQEQCRDSVIWVDEAGLVGVKDMNKLFAIAKQQKARLLLTGDSRQHSSVAAGDALRILEQEAGIPVARVRKIQRQNRNLSYKMAVGMAAEGKADAALLKLDRMGDVVEIADGSQRLERLVGDYAASAADGKSALIVSPTHIEGRNVTDALRQRLKRDGQLAEEERTFLQLKNTSWTEEHKTDPYHYRAGNQALALEFHQNAEGHRKGERWQVEQNDLPQLHSIAARGAKGERQQIDLQQAERFTVYRQQELPLAAGDRIRVTKGGKTREGTRVNNGDIFTVTGFTRAGHIKLHTGRTLDKEFGHLTHGYVTTSHSSQGKTVDHVFIAQSSQSVPASSQQQFYVSISRGRERARIYTDDKRALERAVTRDDQRMTAREVAEVEHRDKIVAEQARVKQQQLQSSK